MKTRLRLERVVELSDPRLGDYRNLKDAVLLRERGRFVVEGRGNLRVLLGRSTHRPESILLGEAAFESLRAELEAADIEAPLFVASQAVLDAIVGFSIHRGALAICPRPAPRAPEGLAYELVERFAAPIVLVLEDVRDADNVGAVFRNAMALGGRAVFAIGGTCDPLYRKAVRTSMGGSLCVPFARAEDCATLFTSLRGAGFEILALDPKEPAQPLEGLRGTWRAGRVARPPIALIVGTEGTGLSPAALAGADRRYRIAMEPGVDSLNVATAAAIALHALRGRAEEVG